MESLSSGNIGMLHGIQQQNLVEIPFVSDNIHQHLANQTFNNLKPRLGVGNLGPSSRRGRQYGNPDPSVVFFPTGGNSQSGAKCQDEESGGGGFNTFGFLSFLITAYNMASLISNNNNNNRNNDNNNNNFQTLESSVKGEQTVRRKKKRRSTHQPEQEKVFYIDNMIEQFARTWIRNKFTSEESCWVQNICKVNFPSTRVNWTTKDKIFSRIATKGLVRELPRFFIDKEELFIETIESGENGMLCEVLSQKCPKEDEVIMNLVEETLFLPAKLFKVIKNYYFP